MDEGHFLQQMLLMSGLRQTTMKQWMSSFRVMVRLTSRGGNVDSRRLKHDLESDLHILREWHEEADKVTRDDDEKLHTLGDELQTIVERGQFRRDK